MDTGNGIDGKMYGGEVFCLGDFTRRNSSTEYVVNLMIYDQLNYLINNKLDKLERSCILYYYFKQLSQVEIGELLDCDRSYISRKLRSGREKLLGYLLELRENSTNESNKNEAES